MRKIHEPIHRIFLVLFVLCNTNIFSYSQNHQPTIPVESFFGHEAINSQIIVARDFTPSSKFSFFGLATYTASYNNEQDKNSLLMINQISYSLGKGFGIMAGVDMNSEVGFSPIIGPEHVYVSQKFLAVTILSYSMKGDQDLGLFGLYQFTPPITDQLSVYTRLQIFYNQNLGEGEHNRSFMYLRAGLRWKRFSFGIGANLNQYGPHKTYGDNYGAFVGWEF
jgi:hypothetical protein